MATRMIVTSQPDVPCDVCGRRLLRGERPDVFLAGGRKRTVCELCAPRAAHEGWRRESQHEGSLGLGPDRPRRGRNLLGRLRQLREPIRAQPESQMQAQRQSQSQSSPVLASAAASASVPVQSMVAEEFELAEPLHGAVASVAAAPLREHGALAPLAAAAREEIAHAEPGDVDSAQAGPAREERPHEEFPHHGPARDGLLHEDPLREEHQHEPPRDQEPEEGSWRDAWMFVGE